MSVKLYSNLEVAETGDAPTAHDVLGTDHTITGGANLDLVGQSGSGVIARVTPSAAPGAAAKVLATTAAGLLTLTELRAAKVHGGTADGATGVLVTAAGAPATPGYGSEIIGTDGSGGAAPYTTAGNLIILARSTNTAGYGSIYLATGASNTLRIRFTETGAVLIGGALIYPPADGRTQFLTYGTVGGFLLWDYSGLDGTARTIHANNAEDVVSAAYFHVVIKPSTGGAAATTVTLAPNSNTPIYNVGSDIVTLYVATDGTVTVARTGGSLTYKLVVQMLWL